MPYYLGASHIDWHYDTAPAELKPTIAGAAVELASRDHTLETFVEQLRAIAAAHPALVAEAIAEDGFRAYHVFRAERGVVTELPLDERPEDAIATAIELPLDELITIGDGDDAIEVPLQYGDENELHAMASEAAASITDAASFVAELDVPGHARYLVELARGRATVKKLVFVGERALAERLLRGDYADPPKPRFPREATRKYEVPFYFPEDLLREIQQEASRQDRSMSWIVQKAWILSKTRITSDSREALAGHIRRTTDTTKRKQTLYFPGDMLDALEDQSARLDSSNSFVVQIAYALARTDIRGLPAAAPFDVTEEDLA
jgi:uncharacterized small protein (TIGR04563 family)